MRTFKWFLQVEDVVKMKVNNLTSYNEPLDYSLITSRINSNLDDEIVPECISIEEDSIKGYYNVYVLYNGNFKLHAYRAASSKVRIARYKEALMAEGNLYYMHVDAYNGVTRSANWESRVAFDVLIKSKRNLSKKGYTRANNLLSTFLRLYSEDTNAEAISGKNSKGEIFVQYNRDVYSKRIG